MSSLRFKAVEESFTRSAVKVEIPDERPDEYYGRAVFNSHQMLKYLDGDTYEALISAIKNKLPIARDLADKVANGMKQWAIDNGALHYSHWFHPLTDGTAEKHDSFIMPDGNEGVIEDFTGKLLVQQEPDASSFPNGGIRNTFEARGYSAWDISSPAFILGKTLCIPTVFISYTGESLDYKTPLLRAINAVDEAASAVARYFDPEVKHVKCFLGWEQEYFLVDEALFCARPDLVMTGRTLLGHESPKNQQLEDHYFGAIPSRVEAFMLDLEIESHRLGIPVKTRHNEVAPNQFELAPVYEETNLANDHNLLVMTLMAEVARRHHFRVLLHEKPFDGVNGSGKHNNWSLGTDKGVELFAPGKTSQDNLQFITFFVNVMKAVHTHNALLKASIMSATNAHRLGANEAPPAIISIFTGSQLAEVLNSLANSPEGSIENLNKREGVSVGIAQIPELLIDNTDRNRTSPFAFTGNRFEFRAPGSSINCASAMIALNAAVADQLKKFRIAVDERIFKGTAQNIAILDEVRKLIKESAAIHFDGNGYSDEWKAEAARRGLDCESCPPKIFDAYLSDSSIKMFTDTGVFTPIELHARNEVKWEIYTKKVQIEARVLGDLVLSHIIPVAKNYQSMLVDNLMKLIQVFGKEKAMQIGYHDVDTIEKLGCYISEIQKEECALVDSRKIANRIEDERERAIAYYDKVIPHMENIRNQVDKLELIVDDRMWPLPKYRELLFIR